MPEKWQVLLQNSHITKMEQRQNPQAVMDALYFMEHPSHYGPGHQKYLTVKPLSGSSSSGTPSYHPPSHHPHHAKPPQPFYGGGSPYHSDHSLSASLAQPMPPSYAPPLPPEEEEAPPPVPDRPARTKSIYTAPRDEGDLAAALSGSMAPLHALAKVPNNLPVFVCS